MSDDKLYTIAAYPMFAADLAHLTQVVRGGKMDCGQFSGRMTAPELAELCNRHIPWHMVCDETTVPPQPPPPPEHAFGRPCWTAPPPKADPYDQPEPAPSHFDVEMATDCDFTAVLAALQRFEPTVIVTAMCRLSVRVTVDAPGTRVLADRLQAVPGVHAVYRFYDAAPC